MKFLLIIATALLCGVSANAQFTKASLQASGLTCSMCSRAVKSELEKVPFVSSVDVDLKTQEYQLSFKKGQPVNFDALSKAVEDAGFSVSGLKVTADVSGVALQKDAHVKIGSQYFHFLNAPNSALKGSTAFTLVDKRFAAPKVAKKWSAASKMECVQTGKAAKCCTAEGVAGGARVYHVVI